jgi:hypothetical protein
MGDLTAFHSITDQLIDRIPELSYLLSTIFMIFTGDYIITHFLLKTLRKMGFITRTLFFMFLSLIIFPTLTAVGALLLRNLVLDPFKDWIILVLAICFFIVGILLSMKYNLKTKIKLKVR